MFVLFAMKNRDDLMLRLNPKFQKIIFQKTLDKYGDSLKAGSILKIPASSVRGYKNLYFDSVPKNLINELIRLKITTQGEIKLNTLSSFIKSQKVKEILGKGREKRNEIFQTIRKEIPPVKKIINSGNLEFYRWFDKYKLLLDAPFRRIQVKNNDDFIIVEYTNHTRHGNKHFKVNLPKKIKLDSEFFFFFGLWCGDRSGGKRFGIANKNNEIINFTEYFLKQNKQRVEKILYITKGLEIPRIKYDKKFELENEKKGWVLSVHSNNGILASFFYYLQSHITEILTSEKSKYSFFAGLFDAEGNVSLYNKSFRWACKNENLIKIYTEIMKGINLYSRYDGSSIVSYNSEKFYNKILPFLKHSEKINNTNFLYNGAGRLPKGFGEILNYINKNPKLSAKDIAEGLKKNKVYSELKLLNDFGFIKPSNYPKEFDITTKGLKSLGE